MLEPGDLYAAVNRLLVGLGQILTAAVLLGVVALLASADHNWVARDAAVLALGFTVVGYALQLTRMTLNLQRALYAAIGASWAGGVIAVGELILGGR